MSLESRALSQASTRSRREIWMFDLTPAWPVHNVAIAGRAALWPLVLPVLPNDLAFNTLRSLHAVSSLLLKLFIKRLPSSGCRPPR